MASRLTRILITGGAGFVGSTIAVACKQKHPRLEVVALDNLKRRGSELILQRLREHEIQFVHGDIRSPSDFPADDFDLLVECSAEPSVLAGYNSSPEYLVQTNLTGAFHCLEFCRGRCPQIIFISTSRVYAVAELSRLEFHESETRLVLNDKQAMPGASAHGISESFPTSGPRSLYGTTKLAAEMLIEEYRHAYGIKAVVNRCGVLAGPWQMGKGDQGVFTFWLASHYFKRPLRYLGFGGQGKQVRDLLHAEDLAALVLEQAESLESWNGVTVNVGGGPEISLSLREATLLCEQLTGHRLDIAGEPQNRPMDIPCYLSDNRRLYAQTEWRPRRDAGQILSETLEWIRRHESALRNVL
jgi:CDP-paratose 2-epimerase